MLLALLKLLIFMPKTLNVGFFQNAGGSPSPSS